MITRFRLEAEADNAEDVQDDIDEGTQAMLAHLSRVQDGDQWECTDEFGPIPTLDDELRAVVYMRRVFRRIDDA